jgi:hypothetical protein
MQIAQIRDRPSPVHAHGDDWSPLTSLYTVTFRCTTQNLLPVGADPHERAVNVESMLFFFVHHMFVHKILGVIYTMRRLVDT